MPIFPVNFELRAALLQARNQVGFMGMAAEHCGRFSGCSALHCCGAEVHSAHPLHRGDPSSRRAGRVEPGLGGVGRVEH